MDVVTVLRLVDVDIVVLAGGLELVVEVAVDVETVEVVGGVAPL